MKFGDLIEHGDDRLVKKFQIKKIDGKVTFLSIYGQIPHFTSDWTSDSLLITISTLLRGVL